MSVMVLYGSHADKILLKEQEIVLQRRFDGWAIRSIDGSKNKKHEVLEAFEQGLFDFDPVLVVIKKPSKIKNLKDLCASTSLDILIIQNGEMLKSLSDFPSHKFDKPKTYKEEDEASDFLFEELNKLGVKTDPKIPLAIIKRVGTDLGLLRYEALKISYVNESKKPTPKEIVGVIAPLMESKGTKVVDAILNGNMKLFLSESDKLRTTSKKDPTMEFMSLLLTNLVNWLEIYERQKKGDDFNTIAQSVGLNPYLVKNVLLNRVRNLGLTKIKKMFSLVSKSEQVILSSGVDAWSSFRIGMVLIFIK